MTWTRATVPTGNDPDIRSRHLLLVDSDGTAPWSLRWAGDAWALSSGSERLYPHGLGMLDVAVAERGLPRVETLDLWWARGGEG